MTEIQLQAILDSQGDPSQDINLDMMTTRDGRRISKFSLEAMTIGEEVDEALTRLFHNFNQDYVGNDSVFPLESGAPKVLTAFRERPFHFELRDEYSKGPRPKALPSVRGTYYHGKPATRKILEHFVRTTPVVSRCDHPRCLSRLVIVPKREPGSTKDSPPTGYRVTMNAVINGCIKPTASITPLATDEIKKLHHYKYYLQLDGSQAFWSIPLTEESKKLLAFQTHEGVFAWDRLTMGAQPSSSVQQGAYHEALDTHIPWQYRHRFALMADDIAAGSDSLEELFDLYKMLIKCLAEAGIQVKPQKLKFGIREIKFHNYKISKERTAVKEENLEPIRQMGIPTNVTEVKAFLGCCGQMASYCQYYAIVAEPLHRLTRKQIVFPKPWIPGTDYDLAFHKLKAMMLDTPLFLWNKASGRRLFIEVDSSQEGWGACVYQYADDPPPGVVDEGRFRLLDRKKGQPMKRVVAWISKAHTPFEKQLPCFYRESLGRLHALEHFRNLIETQEPQAGTTVYTDHLPAIRVDSLSNKGQLSAWKVHETADLNAICQTLHRSGITMDISDPLSRIKRIGEPMHMVLLPLVFKELLARVPDRVRSAQYLRVSAERDTAAAARIVQRWRTPTNPISVLRPEAVGNYDFLITATYADKAPHRLAALLRNKRAFAFLIPTTLLQEVQRLPDGKLDTSIQDKLDSTTKIVMSAIGHTWVINHPDIPKPKNFVLYNEDKDAHLDEHLMINGKEWQHLKEALHEVDHLMIDGAARDKPGTSATEDLLDLSLINTRSATKRLTAGGFEPSPQASKKPKVVRFTTQSSGSPPAFSAPGIPLKMQKTPAPAPAPGKRGAAPPQAPTQVCAKRLKPTVSVYNSVPSTRPFKAWIGEQPVPLPADKLIPVDAPPGFPVGIKAYKDKHGHVLIAVPKKDRIVLINQIHAITLHVGAERVLRALSVRYWWPKMANLVNSVCAACRACQLAKIRRKHLSAPYNKGPKLLPRQAYGIDFYGHAKGNILVAIDLCSREVTLWFVKNRDSETVAKCLLTGLIFQNGVPMTFRSDAAKEFTQGVVGSLNRYLGIDHISTGGYNARANAIVERFMQTLNAMLRKCNNESYNNIKDYLPAIAFAHNTSYSSVLEATPFECGHGLRARTICDARMSPRLQFSTEGDSEDDASFAKWETTVSSKVLELATRLASVAQQNTEWHRRMTSEQLNQAGKPISKVEIPSGSKVYFYKPPTQGQALEEGRMVKHLNHYCGPATVVRKVPERLRNYEISYEDESGKTTTFFRDIAMIVPAPEMPRAEDIVDPSDIPVPDPVLHDENNTLPLREGEIIITKDSHDSTEWYVAEIFKVLPTKIIVKYFATPTPQVENLEGASPEDIKKRLRQAHFRRTWFFRSGANVGKGTVNPPFPNNPDLRVWSGPLPNKELGAALLVRGVGLTAAGKLTSKSLELASQLSIPHAVTLTVEDEETPETPETYLNLDGNDFFELTTATACFCKSCFNDYASGPSHVEDLYSVD